MATRDQMLALIDVHRAQWDSTPSAARANRSISEINRFEAHHTAGPPPASMSFEAKKKFMQGIEHFHRVTKGWSDIFYHLFVFADGEIWAGRRLDRSSQSDIARTLTVHYPGFNPVVTPEQAESALRIARTITNDERMVSWHQERAASACPGTNVIAHIKDFLRPNLNQEPAVPEHTHVYADLSGFPEAQAAKRAGIWDGSDPAMAASRSTVAVMIQRAVDQAVAPLKAEIEELNAVGNEIVVDAEVLQIIVDEIQRRLAE